MRAGEHLDPEDNEDLQFAAIYDGLHCARQPNPAVAGFSSNGNQVIAGWPGSSISNSRNAERGAWKRFIDNCYGLQQQRYPYALFEFGEAERTASITRPPTVRFGSTGEMVRRLQLGLISAGYDLGPSGVDGEFGFSTLAALADFQMRAFGVMGVDLIAGQITAQELGISWPGADSPPGSREFDDARPIRLNGSYGVYNEKYGVTFQSLVKRGFFSSDPDDLSIQRAIRTNNPAGLTATPWQKGLAGYVGFTEPDGVGKRTTIYRTPEHGIFAWMDLLVNQCGYGLKGEFKLGQLAKQLSAASGDNAAGATKYLVGWNSHSTAELTGSTKISIASNNDLEILALAMFGREIGYASPLLVDQIRYSIDGYRSGMLSD